MNYHYTTESCKKNIFFTYRLIELNEIKIFVSSDLIHRLLLKLNVKCNTIIDVSISL